MALLAEHIADLQRSGLADETIAKMAVSSVGPDDLDSRFKMGGVQSALRFEYLQLNGFSPFHRLKFFPPFIKPDGDIQKYGQPGDTGCRLYVPEPVIDIFRDKDAPLLICEGEKKTWAAVQAGLPAVGIGGIYNFNDKSTDWLIPELDEVLKPDRFLTYCPDSDVWLDPRKLQSVFHFGTKIELRTGKFYLVKLPVGPGGKTMGLDDFLLAYGVADFEKLTRLTLKNALFTPFKKQQVFITKKRMQAEAAADARKPAVEVSDADRQEALDLLKDPNLLRRFLDDIRAAGCVGEDDNKTILLLTFTSRKLRHPININVKGESSGGKNHLVSFVGRFFPPEESHFISSATPKALFYLGSDLSHHVIVIAEAPGAEDAQYSIRTMQSENELTILVPEKIDGRIETKERTVKGPVSFIETTTQAHLHSENENRCFDIYIDESEAQTRRIFRRQNKEASASVNLAAVALKVNLWQNAQRVLESMPIVVDFARFIKFPTKPLRVRRDRPRFLALIETCALLHQHQRSKRDIHGVPHVVATLDDYEVARELSGAVLGRVLAGVTPSCQKMVEAVSAFQGEFTATDISSEMKWSRPTTVKYAKEAVGLGCFEVTEGGRGKTYKYKFIKLADSVDVGLPTKEEIDRAMNKPRFTRFADYLKAKRSAANL
jgi:uncharacterized protein DUF3854